MVPKRKIRSHRKDNPTTGDASRDRYISAVAIRVVAGWPTKTESGQDMPHASKSAVFDRLVALVLDGHHIDQLRARANAYLKDCAPTDRGTACVGTKAPQNFFGAKGPWRDYDDLPDASPIPESEVAAAQRETATA